MDQQKWSVVKANFIGTEDLTDGYYRLRETEEGYQLAYLIAGPCGDKIPHPEVTLQKVADQIEPIHLRDLEETPILNLTQATDAEKIEELTDQLLERFLMRKNLSL
ncbi:hypothetical protein [Enterococcus dongliensis]|uniref:hypothetical protein n=1 Tax=Enterococcus dongliensis TaxID=2559925 RepID=UPI0028919516|nr:hypothetical protein [Enterococcus dongliensis]MDT2702425.1 hypothetical protein [Enterococcus dongliensis]